MHDVTGGPDIVGEGAHAGGQPLCVVEQQDLGHTEPPGEMVWHTFGQSTESSPRRKECGRVAEGTPAGKNLTRAPSRPSSTWIA